jgi:osmotically-inducible protein OsmY
VVNEIEFGKYEVSILSPFMRRICTTAAAAVILCGAAGCVGARKTDAERAADSDMADRVQAAFAADKMLYSRHITVRADNGVVTLGGYAWTTEELEAARQDALQVSGVTKVVNRIEVDRGAVSDSAVTR